MGVFSSGTSPLGGNQTTPPSQHPLGQRPSNRGNQSRTSGGNSGPGTRSGLPRGGKPPFGDDSLGMSNDDNRRRSSAVGGMSSNSSSYGDANQLFLGNLPHSATEEELKELFSQFGNVVELRIHSKPGAGKAGGQGARVPPNYGFITYEDQQSVQNCLAARVRVLSCLLLLCLIILDRKMRV